MRQFDPIKGPPSEDANYADGYVSLSARDAVLLSKRVVLLNEPADMIDLCATCFDALKAFLKPKPHAIAKG